MISASRLRPALFLTAAFGLSLPACGGGTADETSAEETGDDGGSTTGDETGDESGDTGAVEPWAQPQAEAFCAKLFTCDCSANPPPYADEAECVATLQGFYEELDGIRMSRDDLEVNEECLAGLPWIAENFDCDARGWPEDIITDCAIVYGPQNWGNQCDNYTAPGWFEQYSDCGTDLICDASTGQGFCLDRVPDPIAGGETCVQDPFIFDCEAGFICDDQQTQYCNAAPDDGDWCISAQCGESSWCNPALGMGEGVCEALVADGQPCIRHEQCASGTCDSVSDTCEVTPEPPILLCALPKPGP
jgi:hypothetical protein